MLMHSLSLCFLPHMLIKAHAHRLSLSFVVVRRWLVRHLLVGLFSPYRLIRSLSYLAGLVRVITTLRRAIFWQLLVVDGLRPITLA